MIETSADPITHNELTRRLVVWWMFLQWNALVFGVLAAMVFKGWELSPATTNVIMIALTTESAGLAAVGAFYLGMQYQKSKT